MSDEKYKEVYHDMKKQGHMQKTTYDKYRERLQTRDLARKKREFEERKIKLS